LFGLDVEDLVGVDRVVVVLPDTGVDRVVVAFPNIGLLLVALGDRGDLLFCSVLDQVAVVFLEGEAVDELGLDPKQRGIVLGVFLLLLLLLPVGREIGGDAPDFPLASRSPRTTCTAACDRGRPAAR
jgi:hypothetical protein